MTHPPLIERVDRGLAKLEDALALIAGGVIVFLMIAGVSQIFARTVLNAPIFGYLDLAEQSAALFAFLGIAYCQRLGGHIRMDLVLDHLHGRLLYLFELVGVLIAVTVVVVLVYYSYLHFQRAWLFGDTTIDANIPTWPTKLLVPLALGVLTIRLFVTAWGFGRLLIDPRLEPIAVPQKITVKEQADEEINAMNLNSDQRPI
jgi:TRAP-type C4-dicarboxylate transport system permease small subunit